MIKNRPDTMTEDEIHQFFEILFTKCKEAGVYSVIETAEEMGIPYES